MFNIAICSNELNQINTLSNYLIEFSLNHNFKYNLSKFKSFDDLVTRHPKQIDILLITIDLSNKEKALNIHKKIESLYDSIQIIFIPDLVDFMLNGFSLKDFRYILKPLKYPAFEDEFLICVNELSLSYKHNLIILFRDILFAESAGSECIVYTDKYSIRLFYTIDELEEKLDTSIFFRCHEDFLINLNRISKLSRTSVVIDSKIIPVSNSQFCNLKNRLLFLLKIV